MDQKLTKEMAERRAVRQNLVKTADRSEKIRTYNYAQVRQEAPARGICLIKFENIGSGHRPQAWALPKEPREHHGG
jgi:peptide chain release factor 1